MTGLSGLIQRTLPPTRVRRSLRSVAESLPEISGVPSVSLKRLLGRLSAPSFTLLSYNTFLMDVEADVGIVAREVLKEDSSIPMAGFLADQLHVAVSSIVQGIAEVAIAINNFFGGDAKPPGNVFRTTFEKKPACGPRANEIGDQVGFLAGQGVFDVVAPLSEIWTNNFAFQVFQHAQAQMPTALTLLDGPRPGPEPWRIQANLPSSGLRVIGTLPMTKIAEHTYSRDARGSFLRDVDWWASKGAMMTRLDTMGIDLVSTHMHAGGGIMESPFCGALLTVLVDGLRGRVPGISELLGNPDVIGPPTESETRNVRAKQLSELATLIRQSRDPRNVLIVTGDFNLNGNDPADLAVLKEFREEFDLQDVWDDQYREKGVLVARGSTDNGGPDDQITQVCPLGIGSYGAEACDEQLSPGPLGPIVGKRLDYLLIERPKPQHRRLVTVEVVERVPFKRPGDHSGGDDPKHCSDHIGLISRIHSTDRHVFANPKPGAPSN